MRGEAIMSRFICSALRVKFKRIVALAFRIIGGMLAFPSMAALFFGGLALKFVPWYPSMQSLFVWGVALGLAAVVGTALLNQSLLWCKELDDGNPSPEKDQVVGGC